MPDALERARRYRDTGADCVFPIALFEVDALRAFLAGTPGPVNILKTPRAPSISELAELGVARVSYGGLLQRDAIQQFAGILSTIVTEAKP